MVEGLGVHFMGKHTDFKLQTRVGRKTTNIRRFPQLTLDGKTGSGANNLFFDNAG
jgi:hypothetical protein